MQCNEMQCNEMQVSQLMQKSSARIALLNNANAVDAFAYVYRQRCRVDVVIN